MTVAAARKRKSAAKAGFGTKVIEAVEKMLAIDCGAKDPGRVYLIGSKTRRRLKKSKGVR